MALATQCPHCHTTFRVAHDQLKLRAGLVRCGSCKQIFNGIENLLRPEDVEPADNAAASSPVRSDGPAVSSSSAPAAEIDAPATSFSHPVAEEPVASPSATSITPIPVPEQSANLSNAGTESDAMPFSDDPLLRMTLMDFTDKRDAPASSEVTEAATSDAAPAPHPHDPLDQAMEDLTRKPLRTREAEENEADALDQADDAGYDEPRFVRVGRRRQRIGQALEIVMILGSAILLLAVLAQGMYVFRNQIAARFPQTKQALSNACTRLGCQVGLPAQIDAVSIESNELQALAPDSNAFTLSVLLRNRGSIAQAWPNIELTLNDTNDKPIARRVFMPRDYLAPSDVNKGFAASSEQPVKLSFELTQLKASGYRVYLFYP
jgi:predicted Zn finger-like uncharacterized protein